MPNPANAFRSYPVRLNPLRRPPPGAGRPDRDDGDRRVVATPPHDGSAPPRVLGLIPAAPRGAAGASCGARATGTALAIRARFGLAAPNPLRRNATAVQDRSGMPPAQDPDWMQRSLSPLRGRTP